jgi:hypothetical protein
MTFAGDHNSNCRVSSKRGNHHLSVVPANAMTHHAVPYRLALEQPPSAILR